MQDVARREVAIAQRRENTGLFPSCISLLAKSCNLKSPSDHLTIRKIPLAKPIWIGIVGVIGVEILQTNTNSNDCAVLCQLWNVCLNWVRQPVRQSVTGTSSPFEKLLRLLPQRHLWQTHPCLQSWFSPKSSAAHSKAQCSSNWRQLSNVHLHSLWNFDPRP